MGIRQLSIRSVSLLLAVVSLTIGVVVMIGHAESPDRYTSCVWSPYSDDQAILFRKHAYLVSPVTMQVTSQQHVERWVSHAAFSQNGKWAAAVEVDGNVWKWPLQDTRQQALWIKSGPLIPGPIVGCGFIDDEIVVINERAEWSSGSYGRIEHEPMVTPIWRAFSSGNGKYWITIAGLTQNTRINLEFWTLDHTHRAIKTGDILIDDTAFGGGMPLAARPLSDGSGILSFAGAGVYYIPSSSLKDQAQMIVSTEEDCQIAVSGDEKVWCSLDAKGLITLGRVPSAHPTNMNPVVLTHQLTHPQPLLGVVHRWASLALSLHGDRAIWLGLHGHASSLKFDLTLGTTTEVLPSVLDEE